MTSVGAQSLILKASDALEVCLSEAGKKEHFSAAEILFREESSNAGVFLIAEGEVCLKVKNLPRLDRVFGSGSVLGLPSSFTGQPYSLTAVALTDADVVHVLHDDFIRLMREQPELCREATEMLGREVTFI